MAKSDRMSNVTVRTQAKLKEEINALGYAVSCTRDDGRRVVWATTLIDGNGRDIVFVADYDALNSLALAFKWAKEQVTA